MTTSLSIPTQVRMIRTTTDGVRMMRATTQVAMAVNHVGQRDARIEAWEGTFAECIMRLAEYLGPISMATRFDIVLARSEEEARKGLIVKGTKANQMSEGIDMGALERMMSETASSEATIERVRYDQLTSNGDR